MEAPMETLLSSVVAPINNEKIYKEECMYSFDNPETATGLYVCMRSHYAFGKKYVGAYSKKSNSRVFLHLKRRRKIIPKTDEPEMKKPTRIALNVEGGFDSSETKFEFEDENSVVILPEWKVLPLPDDKLPGMTKLAVHAILDAESITKKEELAAMNNTWEGDVRLVSKYAENLQQLDNGKKVSPSGWKCERCELDTNLWLNLTDGAILCGRRYFDGTGGNNHAVDYYAETKYPLAVKLGTITSEGGDVYSYDEDDMVLDPKLPEHLAHFGIDIMSMKKTDKTMVELEIDANNKLGEWDVIQEAGQDLVPCYGAGFTGMHNLGNSCYMNSCMQVLFTIQDFVQKYPNKAESYFSDCSLDAITSNFNLQMAKLGNGLRGGDYSLPIPTESEYMIKNGISPNQFKLLVGKGSQEFSSKKQQDVHEYLLHLFNIIERNSRGSDNPLDSLMFNMEERTQCTESKCVSYKDSPANYMLTLPLAMDKVENAVDVSAYEEKVKQLEAQGKKITDPKEIVRPRISLKSCLHAFTSNVMVPDYYSSAVKKNVTVAKCNKMKNFPPYLFLHMQKYTMSENWTPKKLDISLDVPDELDLSAYRAHGRQEGEEDFPVDTEQATPVVNLDEGIIAQLVDMGFDLEGCKKAVFHTNNTGIEPAMNWVMEHMADADFASPFQPPGANKSSGDFVASEDGVMMIMSMGFTRDQAVKALKATDNSLDRAADWIFSHADELDTPMETDNTAGSSGSGPGTRDGDGKYKLRAFISHMGTSTAVGHYVCHILREGQWYIFNDEKVAESKCPPRDLAYVYLYERTG